MKTLNRSEILLLFIIIARSTSFIFSKTCLNTLSPFMLLFFRFTIAFALLLLIFRHRLRLITRKTLLAGGAVGLSFFAVMTAETYALTLSPSSTVALLENTAIIFVPFMAAAVYKKKPNISAVGCAIIAMTGVALIVNGGQAITPGLGILLGMLSAVLYSAAILVTDYCAKTEEPILVGVIQLGTMAVLSGIAGLIFETPLLPSTGTEWSCILILAVVCSCFGFALQPLAQKGTTAERAGLFCAFSPAVAAFLGWLFLHEVFGILGFIGSVLIILSVVLSTVLNK